MNVIEAIGKCKTSNANSRAPNTARAYGCALDLFGSYLASQKILPNDPIDKLDMDTFIGFPGWLLAHEYSKKTVNSYLAGVKSFLDWLVIEKYLLPDYNESLRLKMAISQVYRRKSDPLPRWPKRGDVEKMVKAVYRLDEETPRLERDIAVIEFLRCTGCRCNEAALLKISDIDMLDRSAVVTGKRSKQRRVFFTRKVHDLLRHYWELRGSAKLTDPVFARHDRGAGKKIKKLTTRTIQDIVELVAITAGIEPGTFTPHYFRHSFAIKLLQETKDIALVQDLMGHSDPKSTRVYAKIYPDDLRDAHREIFDK